MSCVLIDVLKILGRGGQYYHDNKQILIDLLRELRPGATFLRRAARTTATIAMPGMALMFDVRPDWIRRIVFVAPKLDVIQSNGGTRQDDRASQRDMVKRPIRSYRGLDVRYTNCSSIFSTYKSEVQDGQRYVYGLTYVKKGADGRDVSALRGDAGVVVKPRQFPTSTLPAHWPMTWLRGDYTFPKVLPAPTPDREHMPLQRNLDSIFRFLIGTERG